MPSELHQFLSCLSFAACQCCIDSNIGVLRTGSPCIVLALLPQWMFLHFCWGSLCTGRQFFNLSLLLITIALHARDQVRSHAITHRQAYLLP